MSFACFARAPAGSWLVRSASISWLVLVLLMLLVAPRALAQEAPAASTAASEAQVSSSSDEFARQVFQAGKAAYAIGNYHEALKYFQQAYELSGRATLLFNIGQAADRLRLDETALTALQKYLEQVPDANNRLEVAERIKVLQEVVQTKRDNAQSLAAAQAEATAPTPEETAKAAQPTAASAPSDATASDDDGAITTRWWFWAGIGVAAVTVTVVAIAVGGGGSAPQRDPLAGSNGKVIATLRVAQ